MAALAVVAIGVIGVVVFFALGGDPTVTAGPLLGQSSGDGQTITSIATDPRETVSMGLTVPIRGPLKDRVVLDSVELIEPSRGLEVEGMLVSTGRGTSFSCVGTARVFPPHGCRTWPVSGWEVSEEAISHEGFQVVLGLSVETEGVEDFPAFAVNYHSGGSDHRAVFLQGGQLCASQAEFPDGYPGSKQLVNRQDEIASTEIEGGG
jgi:hypothetical protein